MKAKFTAFVTNTKSTITTQCQITILTNNNDFYAQIRDCFGADESPKEINVTASSATVEDTIEELINLLENRGYKITSVSGIPELESNEITDYMFKYFSDDTKIPFNISYRNKLSPNNLFGGKYTRNYLAINVDDNIAKLNYTLLNGELRTAENSFGGLLLNERNELIYKVDSAESIEEVKDLAYTYIEQFIGVITHTGFSVYDPTIKQMIDDLKN
jgi:hypothetical protein